MTWTRSYLSSRRVVSTDAAIGALAVTGSALTVGSTPAVGTMIATAGGLLLGLELEVALQ